MTAVVQGDCRMVHRTQFWKIFLAFIFFQMTLYTFYACTTLGGRLEVLSSLKVNMLKVQLGWKEEDAPFPGRLNSRENHFTINQACILYIFCDSSSSLQSKKVSLISNSIVITDKIESHMYRRSYCMPATPRKWAILFLGIHSRNRRTLFFFIRTFFIRTLRLRNAQKLRTSWGWEGALK